MEPSAFARELADRLRHADPSEYEAAIDEAIEPVRAQVGTVALGTSGQIRSHPPIDTAGRRALQERITRGLRAMA